MFGLLIVTLLAIPVALYWLSVRRYAKQTADRILAEGAELDQVLGNDAASQAAEAIAERFRF